MPTYEYKCEKCSHQFEAVQKMTEEPLKRCPNCRGKLVRLLFAAGIIFKGDGFYVTEQRKLKEKKAAKLSDGAKPSGEGIKAQGNNGSKASSAAPEPKPEASPKSDAKSGA